MNSLIRHYEQKDIIILKKIKKIKGGFKNVQY